MKTAIIGSRGIDNIDLSKYILPKTNEIVSGGAKGIDALAREYEIGRAHV